jgi:hypothetical protein
MESEPAAPPKKNVVAGLFFLALVGFLIYKMLRGSHEVFDSAHDEGIVNREP